MTESAERYETDDVTVNDVIPDDVIFAIRHPYEYVEKLRASQGATCACCSSDASITSDAPRTGSAAVQKETGCSSRFPGWHEYRLDGHCECGAY